jgi:SagB-type dehydrogenase family enzyme
MAHLSRMLCPQPGLAFQTGGDGKIVIYFGAVCVFSGALCAGAVEAMLLMRSGAIDLAGAQDAALMGGDSRSLAEFELVCHKLRDIGALQDLVEFGGIALFKTLRKRRVGEQSKVFSVPHSRRIRLCHSSYLRPLGSALRIECAGSGGHTEILHSACLAAFFELRSQTSVSEIAERTPDLQISVIAEFVVHLLAIGAVIEAETPANSCMNYWEFHDLIFHTRSRYGRHVGGYGATYRFSGSNAPAVGKALMIGSEVQMPAPTDASNLSQFIIWDALERRASTRCPGRRPPTLTEIGDLLYRSLRIISETKLGTDYIVQRPFPSGGARQELEVYLFLFERSEEYSGFHYDAFGHKLIKISTRTDLVNHIMDGARWSCGREVNPPLLIVFACRISRMSWKYEGMSYATILKNVGAAMQTVYVAATGLGLACCAVGGGNSDLFAQAVGVDPLDISSV